MKTKNTDKECKSIRTWLYDFICSRISLESDWVQAHVANCPKCQKRLASVSKVNLAFSIIKSQLSITLQTIIRNLRFGREEVKNAILSRDLAKELMEKETEKMKIGKSTAYNVSQAQQKYTNAKNNEVLARVKNEQNYVSLLSLTGDIYTVYELPTHFE